MNIHSYRHKVIKLASYFIWQHFGCPDGRDLEFWLLAEKIIPSPLPWGYPDSDLILQERIKDHSLLVCECDICQYSRKIRETIESKDPDLLIRVINEMMSATYNMGFELNMFQVVMDGSWPSAVEQLEEALKKAKEKRAKET